MSSVAPSVPIAQTALLFTPKFTSEGSLTRAFKGCSPSDLSEVAQKNFIEKFNTLLKDYIELVALYSTHDNSFSSERGKKVVFDSHTKIKQWKEIKTEDTQRLNEVNLKYDQLVPLIIERIQCIAREILKLDFENKYFEESSKGQKPVVQREQGYLEGFYNWVTSKKGAAAVNPYGIEHQLFQLTEELERRKAQYEIKDVDSAETQCFRPQNTHPFVAETKKLMQEVVAFREEFFVGKNTLAKVYKNEKRSIEVLKQYYDYFVERLSELEVQNEQIKQKIKPGEEKKTEKSSERASADEKTNSTAAQLMTLAESKEFQGRCRLIESRINEIKSALDSMKNEFSIQNVKADEASKQKNGSATRRPHEEFSKNQVAVFDLLKRIVWEKEEAILSFELLNEYRQPMKVHNYFLHLYAARDLKKESQKIGTRIDQRKGEIAKTRAVYTMQLSSLQELLSSIEEKRNELVVAEKKREEWEIPLGLK